MDTIDRNTLAELARQTGWPCVSICLTTHVSTNEMPHDVLRLKNMVAEAQRQLVEGGVRGPEAAEILRPASALVDDKPFWAAGGEGLAIFVAPGQSRVYRVDTRLPDEVIVADRFHLRPLALAYHGEERFIALALDRNHTRLFAGDGSTIYELPIEGAPTSLAESSETDNREESMQFRSIAAPGKAITGARAGQFHGHGATGEDRMRVDRFVNKLERAVTRTIGPDNHIPLLLLGVDYQTVAYRAHNTYPALSDRVVTQATDYLSEKDIHQIALRTLGPELERTLNEELAQLRESPSALVTDDVHEILTAAATGRVKTLFFDEGQGPYGYFDRTELTVREACDGVPRVLREVPDSTTPDVSCGWDLVDLAIAETILHGGDVHAFIGEERPVDGAAALLRY